MSNIERRTLSVEVKTVLVALVLMMCAALHGREVKLSWYANPEPVDGYRVYRGIDLLASTTTETTATIQAETGDELSLVAFNTAGASDPATYSVPPPPLEGLMIHRVSSEEVVRENAPASAAIDEDRDTFWHTKWNAPAALPPHFIALELPKLATVSALSYLPRQDGGTNGHVTAWEIESSLDGITWEPWEAGTWLNNAYGKEARLPLREVRFVRLWGNDSRMAAAEIDIRGSYAPESGSITMTLQASGNLTEWTDLESWTREIPRSGFYRVRTEVVP